MLERLYGSHDYTYTDEARTQGMDFVQKYLRMKHVIVFKMSHDVVQVRPRFYFLFRHGLMEIVQLYGPYEAHHFT